MEAIWEWECAWECTAQCPALHRWQGHRQCSLQHCCLLPSHHDFWLIGAAPGRQQPDLSRPHNLGISAEVNPSITGTKAVGLLSHHQSIPAVSSWRISQRRTITLQIPSHPWEALPETELKRLKEAQRFWFRFSVHPYSNLELSTQGCCLPLPVF